MSRRLSFDCPTFALITMCILFTGLFAACSGGSTRQSGNSDVSVSGSSGGVSFRLLWQQTGSGSKTHFTPSFNACVDHGIGAIVATVTNATTTITTSSWPCAAHEGRILGIPDGTDYMLQVNGVSSGPTATTLWTGLTASITINAGQITNLDIVMSYIGGDVIQPTVAAIAPQSNPTITTNVPATDRIVIAFSEPMAISTITATNTTLINSGNTSTVSGIVSYVSASNSAVFIPSAPLAYDTQYVLQVRSCITATSCITDIAGNTLASDYTNTFTIESTPTTTPGAPSGITAVPGNGQVTVDWLASNGTVTYNIYYGLAAGVTTTNGTLIPQAHAHYVHIGRTNNQAYYYLVSAVNSTGETLSAAEVSATPLFPTGNPTPPASLTLTPSIGYNTLTWPTVSGATSYNLYWSLTPIFPDKNSADNVIRGVSSPYTHTPTTEGLRYYYILTTMNPIGESAESIQVSGGVGSIGIIW